MADKISIIIPAYNAEKYLDRCLESIAAQTYHNWEAVVIDDGSTDGTPWVCDSWAQVDNRIKIVHQKNGGARQARNNAFYYITGDWITFVDSDDYIEKDTYSAVFDTIDKEKPDVCVFGATYHYIDGEGNEFDAIKHLPEGEKTINGKQAMCSIMYNDFEAGDGFIWNKVYNVAKLKEKFDGEIPEFFTEIYEDKSWLLRIFNKLDTVVKIKKPLYHYYVLPDSLSHNSQNEIRRLIAGVEVFSQIIEEYQSDTEEVVTATKAHLYMKTAQSLLRAIKLRNIKTARYFAKELKGHSIEVLGNDHYAQEEKKRYKTALFIAKIVGI